MKLDNSNSLASEEPKIAILGSEKPWGRYFGCGKTWSRAILAAEKPARAHSENLINRLCISDTQETVRGGVWGGRNSLVGWASDRGSGGRRFDSRLPDSRFGVTFSSILGCLGMCLGVVWGQFRMGF